jgi:hypothetical protein
MSTKIFGRGEAPSATRDRTSIGMSVLFDMTTIHICYYLASIEGLIAHTLRLPVREIFLGILGTCIGNLGDV